MGEGSGKIMGGLRYFGKLNRGSSHITDSFMGGGLSETSEMVFY